LGLSCGILDARGGVTSFEDAGRLLQLLAASLDAVLLRLANESLRSKQLIPSRATSPPPSMCGDL
jgi:uncharacterized protein YhaN